jgi:hypothetical protein
MDSEGAGRVRRPQEGRTWRTRNALDAASNIQIFSVNPCEDPPSPTFSGNMQSYISAHQGCHHHNLFLDRDRVMVPNKLNAFAFPPLQLVI